VNANPTASSAQGDEQAPEHYWHVPRLIAAWLITAAATVLILVLYPWNAGRIEWLTVVLAGGALVTFALQLGTAQRQGFIARTALSVGGVVIVVAVLTGIALFAQL
jgi:hypothetical protein